MKSISVTELEQNISQVLRQMRDQRECVQVTIRGDVVALLVPAPASEASEVNSAKPCGLISANSRSRLGRIGLMM